MKISLKWINDFVDVMEYTHNPERLGNLLTQIGLEVEEYVTKAHDYENVVTGLILSREAHPKADRLTLCQVMTQTGVVHQIVCGAKNHKAGDKVVVALPEAVLPGNVVIRTTTLRGVESQGMLCSKKELGIVTTTGENSQDEGILILPETAPLGIPFAEYMGWDDVTFDVKVTPNRADCLSHLGLAREISVILNRPLKIHSPAFKLSGGSTKYQVPLEIREPKLCPRYAGRLIQNVQVKPSPDWLKNRLESLGQKSINNIVDITNYVMLELGQPLHAFDLDSIGGGRICVEKSKPGTPFKTLDGREIVLSGEEIIINNERTSDREPRAGVPSSTPTHGKLGSEVLALAGVMGGFSSGVQNSTTRIFLESAVFDSVSIRRTSRKFGIESESSYRFARGVDPEGVITAMNRAVELILQLAGGEALGDDYDECSDEYTVLSKRSPILISLDRFTESLGYTVHAQQLVELLSRLNCQVSPQGENLWSIIPPSYRFDLEGEMDLVEEFARLHGYDQFTCTLPKLGHTPAQQDPFTDFSSHVLDFMTGQGYSQALNSSFVNSKEEEELLPPQIHPQTPRSSQPPYSYPPIAIKNPLTEDMNILRRSLTTSLLKNFDTNIRRGQKRGYLFELGKVFYSTGNLAQPPAEDTPGNSNQDSINHSSTHSIGSSLGHFPNHSSMEIPVSQGKEKSPYLEKWHLGIMAWSQNFGTSAPVLEIKTTLELLFKNLFPHLTLRIVQTSSRSSSPSSPLLHPHQMGWLEVGGRDYGFVGTLHPLLKKNRGEGNLALGELDLESIWKLSLEKSRHPQFRSLPRFPSVQRDLALVMERGTPAGQIQEAIRDFCTQQKIPLSEIQIFDVYQGEKIPEGKKSVAYCLNFQDPGTTLQDSLVQDFTNRILVYLRTEMNTELRA